MVEPLERLKAFIAETYFRDASRPIGDDEPLVSSGVIDSFGLVDLSLFAENEFGARIDASDLGAGRADTVRQISGSHRLPDAMTSLLGRVLELFEAQPGRPFANVWGPGGDVVAVNYGDLVLLASGYANALDRAGVRKGDVVVVIVRPGAPLLSAWLAPLLLGAIPSIFPWPTEKLSRDYYEKSVASLLSICGARTILVNADLEETLRKLYEDLPIPPATVAVERCPPARGSACRRPRASGRRECDRRAAAFVAARQVFRRESLSPPGRSSARSRTTDTRFP